MLTNQQVLAGNAMARTDRALQALILCSRWLIAPFILGLICCMLLIIYRFFADLYELTIEVMKESWHDLVVGVLNMVDLTLVANLLLVVIFSAYANYIRKIEPAEHSQWPPGIANIDFGTLKQKLLASIAGIAAVDALAWYLDLEKYSDTSKLSWAIAFPLMFVVAMAFLAFADWLARQSNIEPE
jgi:uncharacterized protein (TIGR00645 family)